MQLETYNPSITIKAVLIVNFCSFPGIPSSFLLQEKLSKQSGINWIGFMNVILMFLCFGDLFDIYIWKGGFGISFKNHCITQQRGFS